MTHQFENGADVVAAVKAAARSKGVPVLRFIAPLSASPHRWLRDVAQASHPREVTLARVRALLDGEPLPPRQDYTRSHQYVGRTAARGMVRPVDLPEDRQPVDRDPCFKCGVRGDIGCRHRPATPGGSHGV